MCFNLATRGYLLIVLGLFFFFSGCSGNGNAGQTAPDFALKDLSGNTVSLNEYRGQIVLVDFWATWCAPCRLSIPELVDVQKKYRDDGVFILGISLDDPAMFNNDYLAAFKEKFKMNYPILRADQSVVANYLGTENMAIPTLFVVDREGKIVDKFVGYVPGAAEKSVEKLL